MIKKLINPTSIVQIKLVGEHKSLAYEYMQAEPEIRKFFGLFLVQSASVAGWSYLGTRYRYSPEEILKRNKGAYKIIGDEIWENASLGFRYLNNDGDIIYFSSNEEANLFLRNFINEHNLKLGLIQNESHE